MEFKDGRIHGFKLKFKSLDDDTERYLFALVDLLDVGKIEKVPGQSLYASHYDEGRDWIMDQYFEAGRFDLLEAYFTPTGELFFGPIYEYELKCLERMLAEGESARVRRVWRAHLGLLKSHYWFYVKERDKGFQYNADLAFESEEEQRKSHETFVGRIAEKKKTLLAVMTDFRALLVRTGASEVELERLDADMACVDAEVRAKPQGKKDNRAMSEEVFWELIDRDLAEKPLGERIDLLPERLALFKPAAIRKFDQILRELDNAAYRSDIWALAYLLQGGCSDDSFDAFRGWLILQGRQVFEATLAAPDQFDVSLHHGEAGGMDALRDAAPTAYDLREGKAMKPVKGPLLELKGPEVEEEEFADLLPKVAAAVNA